MPRWSSGKHIQILWFWIRYPDGAIYSELSVAKGNWKLGSVTLLCKACKFHASATYLFYLEQNIHIICIKTIKEKITLFSITIILALKEVFMKY